MNIKAAEFIVFDVETTGLSAQDGDRIVEIAAMKIKDQQITDRFYSLINPRRFLPAQAMMINQITEEMVADAPINEEVLPKLIDFIGGACVVGHNVRFDLGFLCYELSLMGRRLHEDTPAIDTLKMAKELLPYLSSYKLSYLARSLGVTVTETHRAMADVQMTFEVFRKLTEVAARQDIHDVGVFSNQIGARR